MPYKYLVFVESDDMSMRKYFDDSEIAFEFYQDMIDLQCAEGSENVIAIYRLMNFDKSIL